MCCADECAWTVIDLEATCDEHHRIPREETEIIEIGEVHAALVFAMALTQLAAFVEGKRCAFCSWGDYDKNQLERQAAGAPRD
jgi:inhibitor of KinA sporulation pathway (predicted exonuclease)